MEHHNGVDVIQHTFGYLGSQKYSKLGNAKVSKNFKSHKLKFKILESLIFRSRMMTQSPLKTSLATLVTRVPISA